MRTSSKRWATVLTVLLLTSVIARGARANEFHYVLIFGSQSQPKQLRYTHTWATFVRAVGEGPNANNYQLQAHTISWLPQTLDVKVWRMRPEPGVNLTLDQTFAVVLNNNENVTMWGPFRIHQEVYDRSLRVRDVLNSGAAQYRAISERDNILVGDCIHAVAAVDPIFGRSHYPLIRIGKPASRFIAREVRIRGVYTQAEDHSWLIPRLGLDRYPIEVIPPERVPPERCFLCIVPE